MRRGSAGESPLVRAFRELLGVGPGVDAAELKKAYHRLALLYHPDRNPEPAARESFERVRRAYEILADPAETSTLNQAHVRERLARTVVAGLEISVGTFFGHRVFRSPTRVTRSLRIGRERRGESDVDDFAPAARERDVSILDDPSFDAIEVVYAGKFSIGDDERLQSGLAPGHARQLPWVILNNQGIAHLLDHDFAGALRCFAELDRRVPNNIIFTYRHGLCEVVLGFAHARRGLFGGPKPDRARVDRGLKLLRRAVQLGATRSIGKQRCLVIRKLIADVLDKLGERRRAKAEWREIQKLSPRSREAAFRLTSGRGSGASPRVLITK